MKIEFLQPYTFMRNQYAIGDLLEIDKSIILHKMNDRFYLLVINGKRYDIKVEDIRLIKD